MIKAEEQHNSYLQNKKGKHLETMPIASLLPLVLLKDENTETYNNQMHNIEETHRLVEINLTLISSECMFSPKKFYHWRKIWQESNYTGCLQI